ncbi:MAG: MaoC family dehydratase [Zhengella sp.]|uniref:MaoC family dehydratase n=1 Tax=Zhengella sp. TaxID=2282762 RepID=UPI001D3D46ED|nr:MaoC family dehydratase [Notoacmeibacter sp.]
MNDPTDQSGKPPATLDDLRGAVGKEIGLSPWHEITQGMIDAFADVTKDHNFIHVDPERAAQTPFGGTIAHGFLTLSMLSVFAYQALARLQGRKMGVNFGFEKVRFVNPVPAGKRIRARFTLDHLKIRPSGYVEMTYGVTVEIEGVVKPALTAEWKTIAIMEEGVVNA